MGQARARGTHAERMAESVAKTQAQADERECLIKETEDREHARRMALARANPEAYEREKRQRWEQHAVVAFAAGVMAAHRYR